MQRLTTPSHISGLQAVKIKTNYQCSTHFVWELWLEEGTSTWSCHVDQLLGLAARNYHRRTCLEAGKRLCWTALYECAIHHHILLPLEFVSFAASLPAVAVWQSRVPPCTRDNSQQWSLSRSPSPCHWAAKTQTDRESDWSCPPALSMLGLSVIAQYHWQHPVDCFGPRERLGREVSEWTANCTLCLSFGFWMARRRSLIRTMCLVSTLFDARHWSLRAASCHWNQLVGRESGYERASIVIRRRFPLRAMSPIVPHWEKSLPSVVFAQE